MKDVDGEQVHHRDHHQVTHQALKVQPQVVLLTAATTFEEIHTFQYLPGEEHPKVVDQVRREVDQALMMMNPQSPKPQLGFQEQLLEHLSTNAL